MSKTRRWPKRLLVVVVLVYAVQWVLKCMGMAANPGGRKDGW
jgi:hypothetical protein